MVCDNMDNISHRVVIHYRDVTAFTPEKVNESMVVTLREDDPLYSMVKKWTAESKRGRESLEEDPNPKRPVHHT